MREQSFSVRWLPPARQSFRKQKLSHLSHARDYVTKMRCPCQIPDPLKKEVHHYALKSWC